MVNPISLTRTVYSYCYVVKTDTLFGRQCPGMEMLRLLAAAAEALIPQRVGSSHSKGHILMKVGCSAN